ncbi:MAG: adenosylmethionine--8-amino-7-oxononanoate transaminase [Bacteroidota bacterium]|nr:adenosylmethionine--8-amino-7-oxononanoate transaminase [Bacteroidota bacterium]
MAEKNWQAYDKDHIWHPYTQMQLVPEAIGVDRGEGSYLYLSDGRKIFDAISSWWLTLHGHAHPVIAKAIAAQAKKLEQVIFAGFTHEPASVLAKKLIEHAPEKLEKVFFSDDGSTAVEVAMKMCVQYWHQHKETRTTFLALEGAYHGDTFGAMSASARGIFTHPFGSMLFHVIHMPFPTPPVNGSKEYSKSEELFLEQLRNHAKHDHRIAGFIYEPLLLAAGGMKTWRSNVMEEAVKIAKEYGVLTIADEVMTGFGRTRTFFASDTIAFPPDIMTLSKGITGGFLPLGVTLATKKIYEAFLSDDRSQTFFHGHSYTGNPISCAAAVASFGIFEQEPVMDRIATICSVHNELMPKLAEKNNYNFRIQGTMAAMEPKNPEGYLSAKMQALGKACLDKGMLIRPLGDTIYFLPPYSTTRQDLEEAYGKLQEILDNDF